MDSQKSATTSLLVAIVIVIAAAIVFNIPQFIVANPFWSALLAVVLGGILVNFLSSSSRTR